MSSPFVPPLEIAEIQAAIAGILVRGVLGQGGQGVAYEVELDGRGKSALKIYGPLTVASRVDREIDKLRLLASDFVVRLYGHGVASIRGEDCRFAVMEYVQGVELSALVGRIADADVDRELRTAILDISAGIAAMWSLRVVHRDIKPANIMRRVDGRYVVLDLGLAKHLGEPTLTQMGFTCGTLGYMSPEQAAARRGLTLRSDLFALGVVMYEVATGMHPFHRRQELVGRLRVRPLNLVRPTVSAAVSDIVSRLLDPNPLGRPSRVEEIIAALT